MEVRIRLQKPGKRKSAQKHYNYRIVAISKEKPREGRHLEELGYYDAAAKPAVFHIDHDKLNKWLEKGAQMSDTVKSLVKKTKKNA